jgi:Flp pilus assembly protein TadD
VGDGGRLAGRRRPVIERAAVVLVAVAALAFLGAGLTAARAEDDLFDAGFREQPDVAAAKALEQTAGRATPGVRRLLLLGRVEQRAGDRAGAVALAREAVRREPENAEAWLLLSRTAQGDEARRAAERLRELVPPVDDA